MFISPLFTNFFEILRRYQLEKPAKFAILWKIDTFAFFNAFILELTIKQMEKISKALGDANRLKILHFISNKGGRGECSEIQTVIDLAQPSVSHHIKILIEAGLIEPAKEGRNHNYTLKKELLDAYTKHLSHLQS